MNAENYPDVIRLLQNHRSVRKFINKEIAESDLEHIIRSAQAASSSSHGQSYSIIRVTDPKKRSKLSVYAGNQTHVKTCAEFLVFCADLYRLEQISLLSGVDMAESLDTTEMFLISTIDAALAAQNTAVSAEALGFGIVYTGGLRNYPYEVTQLLNLPRRVYPVFGMCIGYPEEIPEKKPRLPLKAFYFENEYKRIEDTSLHIRKYDEVMKQYYLNRTEGSRSETWTETQTMKRKSSRRLFMKSFLKEQGFLLR
ncbi:oxygen-insensitive NADPH nitroreductase [Paenibacillus validus]|uniref:Oxygen-insensitive NADPH nitroreductase n=1 Tax=Paenibacillus validus TaxID=44253 RepID=A0A7X2ZDQ4_9BACL|nr:oxygen-insensitive NADPH nitroreductase [Paenibacillus validus]MUG72933.1 oxygen-insensitive NADPH nitroreductase [Paenibacillus validus]